MRNSIEEQKIQQATNNILRGEDIDSATYILEKYMFDGVIFIGGRVNPVKVATRQVLNFIKRYQESDYETVCLENNELREITDRIQSEYNDLLKDNFKLKNELETKRKEYQETYKDVREEIKELKEKYDKDTHTLQNKLETTELSNRRLRYEIGQEKQCKQYTEQLENIVKFAITNHIGNLRGGMRIEKYEINKMQNLKLNIDYEPEYNSYVIRVNY